MKKIILSVLLISALMLSMTACGESEKSTDSDDSSDVTTTTIAKDEEVSEVTTTTTAPVPENLPDITDSGEFLNGTYFFEHNDNHYAFNMSDKVLYEYDKNTFVNGKVAFTRDANGIDKIVNFVTGDILLKAEEGNDISITRIVNLENSDTKNVNWLFVTSIQNTFADNAEYSFGIIDAVTGEWVLPVSSEYEICKCFKEEFHLAQCGVMGNLMIPSTRKEPFYNVATDKLTTWEEEPFSGLHCAFENRLLVSNVIHHGNDDYEFEYSIYDDSTGTMTYLGKTSGRADVFSTNNNGYYLRGDDINIVFDKELNILDYDLSEYNVTDLYYATSEMIVFGAKGADSKAYILTLDKNGQNIVEPISGNGRQGGVYVFNDRMIVMTTSHDNYIVDLTTGGINDQYDICAIDPYSGLIQVDEDDNYYLVDPADPDTLINPFQHQ